jgi:hypothetical protein
MGDALPRQDVMTETGFDKTPVSAAYRPASVLRISILLPRSYLATKLAEPLPTTDGGVLRTIGDAISYMTALPKQRELQQTWQHACKLILTRAPVEAITRQRSLALFMDAALRHDSGPRSVIVLHGLSQSG